MPMNLAASGYTGGAHLRALRSEVIPASTPSSRGLVEQAATVSTTVVAAASRIVERIVQLVDDGRAGFVWA